MWVLVAADVLKYTQFSVEHRVQDFSFAFGVHVQYVAYVCGKLNNAKIDFTRLPNNNLYHEH